jgi:hypothetical protein
MSHLSPIEVFQIVDETTANGERTRIVAHLEICARCRQEVELQRRILRVSKSASLVRPSEKLRSNVLDIVAPRPRKNLVTLVVNNLGNVLAMAMVLTVVWFAANSPVPAAESGKPSIFADAVKVYLEYYSRARDLVTREEVRLVGEPAKSVPTGSGNVMLMTVVSVLILVAADRFVVRRFLRIRT